MLTPLAPLNTFLGTGATTTTPVGGSAAPAAPATTTAGGIVNTVLHPIDTLTGAVTSTLFSSRVIAIILGLIFIAGALIVYVGEDVADALGVGSKRAIIGKALAA